MRKQKRNKVGVAVYSPLLEGVLTVQPDREAAQKWANEYRKQAPAEPLRLIDNYPL